MKVIISRVTLCNTVDAETAADYLCEAGFIVRDTMSYIQIDTNARREEIGHALANLGALWQHEDARLEC